MSSFTFASLALQCRAGLAAASRIIPAATAGIVLGLQGCASRPEVPPEPPKPISLLAVLPVEMTADEANAGFGAAGSGVVVPIVVPSGGGISSRDAIGAAVIGAAIAVGIQASSRERKERLRDAVSAVAFDPAAEMESRLAPALEKRQVRLVRITDPQVVAAVRAGQFEGLPEGVDAILDVRITESGYYSSMRAGGFSPMLNVTANLLAPKTGADALDEFGYYADWRDGGKDRRWITTPKSLTFSETEMLKADAENVRAGLAQIVEQMVDLMSDDVQRHASGQLRQD